jgi:hypothetical protein
MDEYAFSVRLSQEERQRLWEIRAIFSQQTGAKFTLNQTIQKLINDKMETLNNEQENER